MGLLDDAIKEHLELKRKHGAGEEEVKRQEDEALGPARRDFAAPAPEESAAEAADVAPDAPAAREQTTWLDEEEPAVEAPPEPLEHAVEPPLEPLASEPLPRSEAAPSLEAEPLPEPERESVSEPEPVPGPELRDAPLPLREEPPPPVERRPETPPQGFPAVTRDEPEEDESGDEDEDVLEETPDFLQDTPEHDRLWFEQKPPRDFDFDG